MPGYPEDPPEPLKLPTASGRESAILKELQRPDTLNVIISLST
jgi:hypothetical protein